MDIEIIGSIAGLLSCVTFVPQIFKTYKSKLVKDISLTTFLIVAVSTLIWLYYGIEKQLPSVIFTNVVVFLSSAAMIGMKLKFGKKEELSESIEEIGNSNQEGFLK